MGEIKEVETQVLWNVQEKHRESLYIVKLFRNI